MGSRAKACYFSSDRKIPSQNSLLVTKKFDWVLCVGKPPNAQIVERNILSIRLFYMIQHCGLADLPLSAYHYHGILLARNASFCNCLSIYIIRLNTR